MNCNHNPRYLSTAFVILATLLTTPTAEAGWFFGRAKCTINPPPQASCNRRTEIACCVPQYSCGEFPNAMGGNFRYYPQFYSYYPNSYFYYHPTPPNTVSSQVVPKKHDAADLPEPAHGAGDGGAGDGGAGDGGAGDGGAGDGGAGDGGAGDGGAGDGGAGDGGAGDGGAGDGGAGDGGAGDGGAGDGGAGDGGAGDGGAGDGGAGDGGAGDGGAGGNPAGGNPAGGNPAGGNPAGGNPAGGNPAGGNPAGGNPAGGNPAGGGGVEDKRKQGPPIDDIFDPQTPKSPQQQTPPVDNTLEKEEPSGNGKVVDDLFGRINPTETATEQPLPTSVETNQLVTFNISKERGDNFQIDQGIDFSETHMREWTDDTGKFRIEARLIAVGADNSQATLLKSSGTTCQVSFLRLSATDRQYINRHTASGQMIGQFTTQP